MEPTKQEEEEGVVHELPGILQVYKNGIVQRLLDTDFIPPSTNPTTGVSSKDITINPEANLSARLYLPKLPTQKLPLLVYFYGGAFCVSSPFCNKYSSYLNKLVSEANVVAVAVDYRKAPEYPIPVAYEDSWAALKWVVSHLGGNGPEPWLNQWADFGRVFLGGESAGANVVQNLGLRAGDNELGLGVGLLGLALVHPYFWGKDPIGSEVVDSPRKLLIDGLWPFICPSSPDNDDPRVNPVVNNGPGLKGLGCRRVLVCVGEKDVLRDRGRLYYEALGRSGWMGVAEIEETEGVDHGFHIDDLECEKAQDLIKRLAAFYNRDVPLL